MRRQYLVNYHLHMSAGEPPLEPDSVVTLDLTPEQEERLIGHSLTLLPEPEPEPEPPEAPKPQRRRVKGGKP
jgi:hypothetical protein